MAKIVVIAGPSASGKSTSYCNIDKPYLKIQGIDPAKAFMFNIAGKEIPVKNGDKMYREVTVENGKPVGNMITGADYGVIRNAIEKLHKSSRNVIIVEDAQYLMAFDFFDRRTEAGYDKYAFIGFSFLDLALLLRDMRNDMVVYMLMHTDFTGDGDNERMVLKTIGKMLNEKFTLEGLFSIVLRSEKFEKSKEVQYRFLVKPSYKGDIAKAPIGMFEGPDGMPLEYINNDLGIVDNAIRTYYSI